MKKLLLLKVLLTIGSLLNFSVGLTAQTTSYKLNSIPINGSGNSAFGAGSLIFNTTGNHNTAIAYGTLLYNTTGSYNTATGVAALLENISGSYNTALGSYALYSNTNGTYNTAVGYQAGYNSKGSGNVFIGSSAGYYEAGSNKLYIDNTSTSTPLIYGDFSTDQLTINGSIRGNVSGALRINSGNGYVDVGAQNTGWAHFITDRPRYYFDKGITVDVGLIGSYDEDLSLQTSGTTRLTISNSSGNVGIGTSSPGGKLDINYAGGQLRLSGGTVAGGVFTSVNDLLYLTDWNTGNKGVIINMTSGNVGIGTATPEQKLHVTGNLVLDPGSNPNIFTGTGGSELNRYLQLLNSSAVQSASGLKAGGILVSDSYAYANPGKNDLIVKGNVGIGTASPTYNLHVQNAYCDGNTWYNASDQNLKKDFRTIANESILDKVMKLKIERWKYKEDVSEADHIGPYAQDFNKVFGLGGNDKAISTSDELGVALAAIQELSKRMEAVKDLSNKLVELEQTLSAQQLLIDALISQKSEEVTESDVKLYQNYPNPFSLDTEIRMDIPVRVNQATLYIYNLQGKMIDRRIISDRGTMTIKIEGNSLSPGIYLYTLITDRVSVGLRRMILTD